MALDKLVDSTQLDSDLTSVANAIRSKAGIAATLSFPSDFVTEIGNIQTGGGVETASVTISNNDANFLYYTDATMTPQSASGNTNISQVQLPVGSLVVDVRTGMAEPSPFTRQTVGLSLLANYTVGSKGTVRISVVVAS